MSNKLPKGQFEIPEFPRFGLSHFARRFPKDMEHANITIGGDVECEYVTPASIRHLARVTQTSDFHCVTSWTHRSLQWSGCRFRDFYEALIVPHAQPSKNAKIIVVKGQDGARTSLLLEDALAPDVLLADRLNGEPLAIRHGGPLRLVAPSLYGYKSVKHLSRIDFRTDYSLFRPSAFRFMDHPRARVEREERGRWLPGWLLRYLYRPLIGVTRRRFAKAMNEFERNTQ